jgi:predicted RNase H-like nuclease (RuvC/YqgF family)
MASSPSPRPDSAVSMQDIDIVQLQHEIEQLRFSETALEQECSEWKKRYQDEKAEVSRLSGSSSKEGRRTKSIKDRCSKLEEQLASSVDEVSRLRDSLSKAQKHIREA